MENAAKGEEEIFLCFITLGGREGKASESKKKKQEKEITMEKPSCICYFCLLTHFKSRCLEQKGGREHQVVF